MLKSKSAIVVIEDQHQLPYCQSCGTKLEENAKFCQTCGAQAPIVSHPVPLTALKPIRKDPLFVWTIVIVSVIISVLVIGAIILFAFFHVNFGQNNTNQQNITTLNQVFNLIMLKHKISVI